MADDQDADTSAPVKAEVLGDDEVLVAFGDSKYSFPASLEDADGDVLEAIDDQKLSYVIKGLLSDEDLRRFKATKPKVRDYAALFDAYAQAIGLPGAGES